MKGMVEVNGLTRVDPKYTSMSYLMTPTHQWVTALCLRQVLKVLLLSKRVGHQLQVRILPQVHPVGNQLDTDIISL